LASAALSEDRTATSIEHAVVRTVAYADVFDFPLTATDVQRYLVGVPASLASVQDALRRIVPERLAHRDGFYMLRERRGLVETRRRRAAASARLWPQALRYGRALAALPYVRMVAVTGSLARDNVESGSDIDYLVVTAPGRVWVGRGLMGILRRAVGIRGTQLCPNYVLSEQALLLPDRSLFTANELAQMVPLTGQPVYRQMRHVNGWTAEFLPNAEGRPRRFPEVESGPRRLARLGERALGNTLGDRLERLEWARFERKLSARTADANEVLYSADSFKDHVDGWGGRILAAYAEQLAAVGADG